MKKRFAVVITFHDNNSPKKEERIKRAYGRLISMAVESILARQEKTEIEAVKQKKDINPISEKGTITGIINI